MDLKTGDLDIETQKFLVIATTFKQLGILASIFSCVDLLIIRRSQISSKTGDLDLDLQAKIGIKL